MRWYYTIVQKREHYLRLFIQIILKLLSYRLRACIGTVGCKRGSKITYLVC